MKCCDELPAKFFKDNFAILGNVILDICHCCLSNGTFPDALIIAMVICLYNSPFLCDNYRSIPISSKCNGWDYWKTCLCKISGIFMC